MQKFGGSMTACGALALMLALAPLPVLAQTPDFTIPTGRPTGSSRAAGPVDDQNPIVRAPSPRPSPAPVLTPEPVVTPAPAPAASSPAPSTRPAPASPRPASGAAAPGTRRIEAAPAGVPAATPSPTPASGAALPPSGTVPEPAIAATNSFALPQTSDPAPTSAAAGWYWPWIAGAAGLLASLFALLWWRRRPRDEQLEFDPPVVPAPSPAPAPAPAPQPAPAAPKPAAAPLPESASGLAIALEAQRITASLMATTLNYTLRLTNNSGQSLSALAVEGDMISAHASLPPEQQIANDNQRLELRHALVTLAPGESAEFTGDFRLPLSAITPIRAGEAAYFVPLARLRVEASQHSGQQMVEVQTFVVGELPEQPGAALRPFRLDLGPRTYSRIGQRAVS